jgi:hypothetical protein
VSRAKSDAGDADVLADLMRTDRHAHRPVAGVLEVHDQVAGQLCSPRRGGMGGGTENTDAAGGVLDDGDDLQPRAGQYSGFEEVGGEDRMCLAAQKDGPGLAVALGCGLDAVGFEDLPHRGGRDLDPQGGQFAVGSPVVRRVNTLVSAR